VRVKTENNVTQVSCRFASSHTDLNLVLTRKTRHRASTSMYSLTFRVHVTTPPQYGRNGTVHAAGASMLSPARRVCRHASCACAACVVCVSGMRAVSLADYRWALWHISIVLP